jgi:SAM-dependent methyltransferase
MSESLERLEFDEQQNYDAYLIAQHLVRYSAAMRFVRGKRVLDVACGSGYGVKLLSDWGAKEVVGIDVSESAIASALSLFSGKNRQFLVGDAEELFSVLSKKNRFDVITCFETIEHLERPEKLLEAISVFASENGIVFISCPNDAMFKEHGMQSEFHAAVYDFEKFKNLTETHLGKAAGWLLGSPIYGELNYVIDSEAIQRATPESMSIFKFKKIPSALQIPSQQKTMPTAATVSHFVGIWGVKPSENAVFIAQSVPSFIEPWKGIEYLSNRNEKIEQDLAKTQASFAEQENESAAEIEQLKKLLSESRALTELHMTRNETTIRDLQEQRERTLQLVSHVGQLQASLQEQRERVIKLDAMFAGMQSKFDQVSVKYPNFFYKFKQVRFQIGSFFRRILSGKNG